MTAHESVQAELLTFLRERTGQMWSNGSDLFGSGGFSSLFAMELVVHLEQTYHIAIRGNDLKLANFRTVREMAALVERLRASARDGIGA